MTGSPGRLCNESNMSRPRVLSECEGCLHGLHLQHALCDAYGLYRSTGQVLCMPNEEVSAPNNPKPPLKLFSRSVLADGSLMLGRQTN